MPIAVNCSCGQVYQVRDEYAGRPVQCSCGQIVSVPSLDRPATGPRLRLPPEAVPVSAVPSAPAASAPALLLVCTLCIIVGGAGLALALNWHHLANLFGSSSPAVVEDAAEPEPEPDPAPIKPPVADPRGKEKSPAVDLSPPLPVRHPPFEGHAATVFRVAFSPDSLRALTASGGVTGEGDRQTPAEDSTLRLWDVRSGQLVKRWQGFGDGISAAAFSPGGRFAIIAAAGRKTKDAFAPGADLDLHVWDLREGKEIRKLTGHLGEVFCITISPDGKQALSGGKDRVIRLWETETGREINRLVGHSNTVNSVAFTPDGRFALSGGSDQTVRYWELERGVEVRQLAGHQDIVWSVAVAPDGRHALSAGGYQSGPGNRGLVPGSKDFAIRLWDLTNGKELRRLEGHTEAVSALAFTPDSRRVVSASADRSVRLWLAGTAAQIQSFTEHTRLIHSVAVSLDGKHALSGGEGGELKAWRLPAELSDLQRALREGVMAERIKAAGELGQYGTEARHVIPDLLRSAMGDDEGLRRASLASLVLIGKPQPDHLAQLEPLLLPGVPLEVRRHVLDSLAALGPDAKPASASIAGLLKDGDPTLRTRAARALGLLGPKNRDLVQPLLIEALRDTNADVSTAARQGLDALGLAPPSELKPLTAFLADPVDVVRRYALDALAGMKENARPAAAEVVRVASRDASPELRRVALQALTAINPRDKIVLDAFAAGLKDPSASVVRQAVKGLVEAGAEVALPGLLAALEHKDAEVVKSAEEAIDNTKWDKTNAKALGDGLLVAAPAGRTRLLKILAGLGADAEDAVAGLRELLKKTEAKDAPALIATIAKLGVIAKEAGPELVPFLKRDPKVTVVPPLALETAHLLVDIEAMEVTEAIPVLISAIRVEDEEDESGERRDRAMKALVKVGKPAVPRLARALEGEYAAGNARTPAGAARAKARYRVMEVLVGIGPKVAATPDVLKVLASLERFEPFPEVRVAARQARMMLMQKDDPAMKDDAKEMQKDAKKDG